MKKIKIGIALALMCICLTSCSMQRKIAHIETIAGKFFDIIRNSIDNGDTTVVKIMREVNPDVEQELPKYIYCY